MPSSPARSFGALLKRHRHAANLTQEGLAERAGISVDTISALERGVNLRPRQDTLDQLADALALAPAQRTHLQAAARGLLWTGPSPATVHHRAAAGAALPPLVGRAQELAHLEQHLAGDGPPIFLLAGEPGIGKSRLLHEAAQQASEQGWTVLMGGCHPRSSQDPYTPVLTALEGRLRGQPAAQTRRELEGCAWLVRLLPELAERRLVPAPSWTLPPEQERRLLFAAVARYLANIAGPAGTLLVLDDLQWAGSDALDLLSSLLRTPTETPVRLLGAYRSTEVRAADPMGGLVAEWARAGLATLHPLEALVAPDARALLDSLLAGEEAIAPTVREQVLTRTGGVPYFLVSCAQALRVPGPAEISQNVPWDVAQSIRQRAAALPQGAQDLLGIAAIAGRRAPRRLLLSVAGAWGQRPSITDTFD
jgi:predicted ATPase/DNA-binding XRE family transcriptional regulator